jgi:hypothetical protein
LAGVLRPAFSFTLLIGRQESARHQLGAITFSDTRIEPLGSVPKCGPCKQPEKEHIMIRIFALPAVIVLAAAGGAGSVAAQDWSGGYFGGQFGSLNADTTATGSDNELTYGLHAGYLGELGNGIIPAPNSNTTGPISTLARPRSTAWAG